MSVEEIKSYLAKEKSARICLSDGRAFTVVHPDYLMFPPFGNGLFLFLGNKGQYMVLNRDEIVSLEPRMKNL